MRDIDGTLWNAQFIGAAGATEFLKPGRRSGCFFVIGKSGANLTSSGLNPAGLNLICVEFATAATCFEAVDVPVVVAFIRDNLLPVAQALHAAYPKAKFIICGDDDWKAPMANR
jgi:putative DNA primase/helicase